MMTIVDRVTVGLRWAPEPRGHCGAARRAGPRSRVGIEPSNRRPHISVAGPTSSTRFLSLRRRHENSQLPREWSVITLRCTSMRSRSSLLILVLAAGSGCRGRTGNSTPAEVMAVPLTAAAAIASSVEPYHTDIVPPWTLTASDGSGLVLARVDAK